MVQWCDPLDSSDSDSTGFNWNWASLRHGHSLCPQSSHSASIWSILVNFGQTNFIKFHPTKGQLRFASNLLCSRVGLFENHLICLPTNSERNFTQGQK